MRNTAFKRSLKRLSLGAKVKISPAAGSFTLHKNPAKPRIFLAGEIGITPFLSIVQQADRDWLSQRLYLFLFESAARRRSFPRDSEGFGDDKSQFPLDLHHD
jgi:ferredoxin-NADP reductase